MIWHDAIHGSAEIKHAGRGVQRPVTPITGLGEEGYCSTFPNSRRCCAEKFRPSAVPGNRDGLSFAPSSAPRDWLQGHRQKENSKWHQTLSPSPIIATPKTTTCRLRMAR